MSIVKPTYNADKKHSHDWVIQYPKNDFFHLSCACGIKRYPELERLSILFQQNGDKNKNVWVHIQ